MWPLLPEAGIWMSFPSGGGAEDAPCTEDGAVVKNDEAARVFGCGADTVLRIVQLVGPRIVAVCTDHGDLARRAALIITVTDIGSLSYCYNGHQMCTDTVCGTGQAVNPTVVVRVRMDGRHHGMTLHPCDYSSC